MAVKKSWGEVQHSRLQGDPEYVTELLVLQVNRAIRRRMRETGTTQTDLAKRLGVSQPYVSKMLNYNRNLTLRSLALIANALNADWAELGLVARTAQRETEPSQTRTEKGRAGSHGCHGRGNHASLHKTLRKTVP